MQWRPLSLNVLSPLSPWGFFGTGVMSVHRTVYQRVAEWTEETLFLVFWSRRWGRCSDVNLLLSQFKLLQSFHALTVLTPCHTCPHIPYCFKALHPLNVELSNVTKMYMEMKTLEVEFVVFSVKYSSVSMELMWTQLGNSNVTDVTLSIKTENVNAQRIYLLPIYPIICMFF